RAITELVYLVEAHHHLNPIFILKYDIPKRINDGIVMLVLESRGIPLRFGEVQLSLVALILKLEVFYALLYNQSCLSVGGGSSDLEGLTVRLLIILAVEWPSYEVVTLGPACPHYLEHNNIHQSCVSCVVGLLAVIDNEFESAITELVYLVEAHHHLNPIFIPKYDSPRRIDNGIVMLILEARGIPLRFGEVQLSLVALNPKQEVFYALSYNQLSGPLVDGRS
nr:hypothetical protein [Tanacetum cinerariifolium]